MCTCFLFSKVHNPYYPYFLTFTFLVQIASPTDVTSNYNLFRGLKRVSWCKIDIERANNNNKKPHPAQRLMQKLSR